MHLSLLAARWCSYGVYHLTCKPNLYIFISYLHFICSELCKLNSFQQCFSPFHLSTICTVCSSTLSRRFSVRLPAVRLWAGSSSTSSRSSSSSSSWHSSPRRPRLTSAPPRPRPSETASSWRWSRESAVCVRRLRLIAGRIRAYVSRTVCLFYPAGGERRSPARLERRPARGRRLWCGTRLSDQGRERRKGREYESRDW